MKRFEKPILVTRPYLPPLDEFKRGLEEVWLNQWLTNNGPMPTYYGFKLDDVRAIAENVREIVASC